MVGTPATGVQRRKLVIALILLLTLVGSTLRFHRLSNQSLWTDEIASITTARLPVLQIIQQSNLRTNCLPPFFLLLHAVLGDSEQDMEFRARWLSALSGALSVPLFIGVVYLWRRRLSAALLGGLLLALNPLHIWYSQEARTYAMMLFFGLLSLLAYELARLSSKPWWWLLYFLSGLMAVALHKTALAFLVACALWQGWDAMRGKGRIHDFLIHAATLGVAFTVLLFKAAPLPPEYRRPLSLMDIAYTFMTFVGGYSFGPPVTDIQSHGAFAAVFRNPIQIAILGAVLALLALAYAFHFRFLIRGKETILLCLSIGAAALGALVSVFAYNVRYSLVGLLAFLAIVATLATLGHRQYFARLSVTGMLLVALWADAQWFYSPVYRKGDSRAVAQWLVANEARVKSWTVLPDYLSYSIEWYLQSHPEILARNRPVVRWQPASFSADSDVLIIGRRHHIPEPDRVIAAYSASAGEVRTVSSIAGFELYVRE